MLDGEQIRARIVDRDITDGPHWSMEAFDAVS
jgi:hypothetical protein